MSPIFGGDYFTFVVGEEGIMLGVGDLTVNNGNERERPGASDNLLSFRATNVAMADFTELEGKLVFAPVDPEGVDKAELH
jgi:hypothetical protein